MVTHFLRYSCLLSLVLLNSATLTQHRSPWVVVYKLFSLWTSLIDVSISVLCLVDTNYSNIQFWSWARLYSYLFLRQFPCHETFLALLFYFFFLLQTSRSEFWGKMHLNLQGTAAFYHCYIQVPCFLFYPLNSNLEILLQCDSPILILEEQREGTQLWQKCTHIHLLVWSAERWGTVWHWRCILRVLSKTGQTL